MYYSKNTIEEVISSYLANHQDLGHSKLAEVMHSAGRLTALSHRQLRRYIGELREAKKTIKLGNKLVIGDLHAPWIKEGYLEFCKGLYDEYKCDSVLFIGDIVDGHSWGRWLPNVDELSVGKELHAAREALKPWYEVFPTAIVTLGNHDLRIANKAKSVGMSKEFIRSFKEIVHAPEGWEFVNEYIENNVVYTHGTTGDAIKKAKDSRMSTVQGHLHTLSYVQWSVSTKDKIFGLQTGAGVDIHAYPMEYAQDFSKKPVISAGLVLNHGTFPLVKLMDL